MLNVRHSSCFPDYNQYGFEKGNRVKSITTTWHDEPFTMSRSVLCAL